MPSIDTGSTNIKVKAEPKHIWRDSFDPEVTGQKWIMHDAEYERWIRVPKNLLEVMLTIFHRRKMYLLENNNRE